MSTHNIHFYGELTKIILQLSSNTHLICSSANLSILWYKEQRLLIPISSGMNTGQKKKEHFSSLNLLAIYLSVLAL